MQLMLRERCGGIVPRKPYKVRFAGNKSRHLEMLRAIRTVRSTKYHIS